jgi:hypothetical protein
MNAKPVDRRLPAWTDAAVAPGAAGPTPAPRPRPAPAAARPRSGHRGRSRPSGARLFFRSSCGFGSRHHGPFDANQRALIDRVNVYLMSIQLLTGDFVQVGSDGRRVEGKLYLQKPGRIRFEYNPPSPIELIADGSSVVVRDRKLMTQDPLSAVADPAALPARRPHRPDEGDQRESRSRPTTRS